MVTSELFQTSRSTRMKLAIPDLFCRTPIASLAQAIDNLQAKERVILSLIYFEALSLTDIASALGSNVLDVQITCDRALAAISEIVMGSQSPSPQVQTLFMHSPTTPSRIP